MNSLPTGIIGRCKIKQGSKFENLKTFITISNEYGIPSDKFIDDFLYQFGEAIIDKYFNIKHLTKEMMCELDKEWVNIVNRCKKEGVQYTETYGRLFYYIIGNYAVDVIIKDCGETHWNGLNLEERVGLLKNFILNFDTYIMAGIDMQQLYFENTPDLVKTDEKGAEYIDVFLNNYEADARGRLYSDGSVVILKGSKVQPEKSSSSVSNDRRIYTKDLILLDDLIYNSVSGAGNFVRGQATNGWMHWKNANGQLVDIYRYKDNNVQNQVKDVNKEHKESNKHSIDKRAEDAAKINALINQNTNTNIVDNVTKQKYHYKLISSDFIGNELQITESVDDISSSYKANIVDEVNIRLADTGLIVDINRFIEEVENRNVEFTIMSGFFKFEFLYREEEQDGE